MTLFSVSTTPSLPGLVRRHLSPHLKFSPCPRWCASSNKEFLLLCQPLPLLLCRSNSPSSSERYRPHRRTGHPDPGSPKKVAGVDFFYGRLSLKKKLILVSLCHRPCGRTWHSYSGEEKFDKVWTGHFWARLASFLVTQRIQKLRLKVSGFLYFTELGLLFCQVVDTNILIFSQNFDHWYLLHNYIMSPFQTWKPQHTLIP